MGSKCPGDIFWSLKMPSKRPPAFRGSKKTGSNATDEGKTLLAECHRKADRRQKEFRRLLRGCAVARLRGCENFIQNFHAA
jgi:hypothetical protein